MYRCCLSQVLRENGTLQTCGKDAHSLRCMFACQVKLLLKRAMCNLSPPGKSFSLDATYRLAKMTTGRATCDTLILGEYGHIFQWSALTPDKWSNILPTLYA